MRWYSRSLAAITLPLEAGCSRRLQALAGLLNSCQEPDAIRAMGFLRARMAPRRSSVVLEASTWTRSWRNTGAIVGRRWRPTTADRAESTQRYLAMAIAGLSRCQRRRALTCPAFL